MSELVFLKLGGSLITDKTRPYTLRVEKLKTLAKEIHAVLGENPQLRLVVGHGSGSFGHYAAQEHLPPSPLPDAEGRQAWAPYWRGFAEVWYRATQLNRHVVEALHAEAVPVVAIQPSASIVSRDGVIENWNLSPLESALEAGILPVIYGDMAFDSVRGGAVLSTETLMYYLAGHLRPGRILLAGLEAAVWADFPSRHQRVGKVTPSSYKELAGRVGGSHGVDVTGGMKAKVEQMLSLVKRIPGLSAQVFSGERAGNVERALSGEVLGTLIEGD